MSVSTAAAECVILLHGLARTSSSMAPLAQRLERDSFLVANIDYPSRSAPIAALSDLAISAGLDACFSKGAEKIHFVTHSLGGVLVRHYLSRVKLPELGHVVMLAPPNQGSEVVDNWRNVPGFKLLNGPAGLQLGTGTDSVPRSLGPVDYSLGVIAGSRSFNPLLSLSLPNPDDGKVSVASTRVEGMTDHIVMSHSHPFIMRADPVMEQVVHFLRHGSFLREDR